MRPKRELEVVRSRTKKRLRGYFWSFGGLEVTSARVIKALVSNAHIAATPEKTRIIPD